ncbi:nucleolus and neural progenitor protein isoform X1 [Sinocyclocheilus rhinocerous]|uniref:Protein nepro homolog n=2 Tax=Sinocyclocheilus rhinocerous TaxID=307959 RepID=A0A673IJD0_9TELE|nr:PREDICTED: protein nepro homolog isoform X1 [Sinocyclocheilus rhinocerous]
MAQEPWNKTCIQFPSAVSSSRIPFTDSSDILIESLLTDCEKVLTLLCSEVLQAEIRVLYELLYVLNNGFRQHKPFRALKQVEQCINRLKEMKLQAAVDDLKELCPDKFQRDAGAEVGECDVPSQPMLEWLCLKLLGASSLLARTLERCTQAFILTRQHLLLSEFVVLNVVITSMLSRLWVFFRGILRALIPMYKRTTELLQKVSQSQPMAYLTDFTLPGDLKDFLCLSYPDLLLEEGTKDPLRAKKGKQKSNFSLLSRLFEGEGHEDGNGEEEREMMPIIAAGYDKGSSLDLGAAVLQRRPDVSPCGLDMKVVLQQSAKSTKRMSLEPEMKTDISSQAAVFQKRKFLKSLRKVSSFRNMAAHLKEMMHWCRSSKFHQERKHLAFLHLKCLRMESLEAEGVRVEKRLKRFKLKVQKALLLQNTLPQKHSSSFIALRRTRWHHGSFMARYRTARRRSAFSRKCSRPVKDFFVSLKHRPQQQSSKEEVSGNNKVPGAEEKMDSQTALQKPNVLNDDIDDIFASFGF